MNFYDIREAELNDKLRSIYKERNELIKMSDVRLRNQNEMLKTLFMGNVMKAQFRNHLLLEEAAKILYVVDSDKKYKKEEEKRFKILRENYLSMIKSVFPVWQNDFEDYKKRRNAFEIKQQAAQNSPYQPPKRISMNLPPVQNDIENDVSEQSSKGKQKQKRRRTPRELMDEIDRGIVN